MNIVIDYIMKFVPKSLHLLFVAELLERISFFILLMFIVKILKLSFGMVHNESIFVYHVYVSLIFLLTIVGSAVADFILGYYESVLCGLILIVLGNATLLISNNYSIILVALSLTIIGNAFIKPALAVVVSKSYKLADNNRDIGFTWLYVTDHLGYLIAGILVLYLYQSSDIRLVTSIIFVISLLSVIFCVFAIRRHKQAHIVCRYKLKTQIKKILISLICLILFVANVYVLNRQLDIKLILVCISIAVLGYVILSINMLKYGHSRSSVVLMVVYFILTAIFASCFYICLQFFTFYLSWDSILTQQLSGWSQYIYLVIIIAHSLINVLLAPFLAFLWQLYGKQGRNISNAYKFLIGLICTMFALLCSSVISSNLFELHWVVLSVLVVLALLFIVCAEVCIIPVGMSLVSRLAPIEFPALCMGGLFFMLGLGSFIALSIGLNPEQLSQPLIKYHYLFYGYLSALGIIICFYILLLPIIKFIHGDR